MNLPDPARVVTKERVVEMMGQFASGARGRSGSSLAFETAGGLMAEWLEALRSSGGMLRIENCEAHDTPFLHAWNTLADAAWDDGSFWNTRERLLATVSHKLRDLVAMPLFDVDKDAIREIPASDVVDGIVSAIHANILSCRAGIYSMLEAETCRNSGIRLALNMDDWKPVMGILNRATRRIEPSTFVVPAPIDHVVVSFRGGPVLVGDWFRIPEFTKAVEVEGDRFELSNELGAREHVRHYARKGFVSVFVGNSSPSVMPFGDGFVVGRSDEDADDFDAVPKELASVCTDLWRATMIEKERLVEIVAETLGRDGAETTVEEYLAENGCDGTINVPAGEYHLYFSGHEERFVKAFHSEDLPLPEAVDPFFVLSRTELTLSDKPTPEASSGPTP